MFFCFYVHAGLSFGLQALIRAKIFLFPLFSWLQGLGSGKDFVVSLIFFAEKPRPAQRNLLFPRFSWLRGLGLSKDFVVSLIFFAEKPRRAQRNFLFLTFSWPRGLGSGKDFIVSLIFLALGVPQSSQSPASPSLPLGEPAPFFTFTITLQALRPRSRRLCLQVQISDPRLSPWAGCSSFCHLLPKSPWTPWPWPRCRNGVCSLQA